MRRIKIEGLLLCTLVASACTGTIGSGGSESSGGPGKAAPGNITAIGNGTASGSSSAGNSGTPGSTTGTGTGTMTAQGTPADPTLAGTLVLRHLSQVEYVNTVRDLLNDTSLTPADVPAESPIGNFDTFPFLAPDVVGSTGA